MSTSGMDCEEHAGVLRLGCLLWGWGSYNLAFGGWVGASGRAVGQPSAGGTASCTPSSLGCGVAALGADFSRTDGLPARLTFVSLMLWPLDISVVTKGHLEVSNKKNCEVQLRVLDLASVGCFATSSQSRAL